MDWALKREYIRLNNTNRLYDLDIPIVGLTGGMASGKSSISTMLKNLSFVVLNADQLIKTVYRLPHIIEFLNIQAPKAMTNGKINFVTLRKMFFSQKKLQEDLENILYTYLKDEFIKELHTYQKPLLAIYDVPLLYEKNLNKLVDVAICVTCTKENQILRIKSRNNLDVTEINKILANQLDTKIKAEKADFVIENNSTMNDLLKKTNELITILFKQTDQE